MTEDKTLHKKYTNGRVFIIRPFNIKTNRNNEQINFDKIDLELITPCIDALGLSGGTTGEFVQQGNIREDMFRELLAADLVVADISIHNANVFYELGIRHALRDRFTVLIKADKHTDPGVFDLSTDRYMSYDLDNPSSSISKLTKTITSTLAGEKGDSPIFNLLPGLTNTDPDKIVIVPLTFREKVEQSENAKNKDKAKLSLAKMCTEIIGKSWETQGLRLIGNAQFKLADHAEAIKTWKSIRQHNSHDIEANQRLATCYQKSKEYVLSEQAAKRALKGEGDWDRAETYALIGSNIKTRWRLSWESTDDLAERQRDALTSTLLEKSYNAYRLGFEQHRSHYFSGLNAVALLSTQIKLAEIHPDDWEIEYDSEIKAKLELEERRILLGKMISATELAIHSSIRNYDDDWARISKADLMLLDNTSPKKVQHEYKKCLNIINGFTARSLNNQLNLYKDLGLFSDSIASLNMLLDEKNT